MSRNIFGMRQRKIDLKKSATAMLAATSSREMTPEENTNYRKTVAALDDVEQEIIVEEARMAADSGEMMPDENSAFALMAQGLVPPDHPSKPRGAAASKKFSDLFGPPRKGAFATFNEFARSVVHSDQLYDPRLQMAGREDSPSDGGFLVPPDQAATVWDQILEQEIVRPRCVVVPMTSETKKFPAVVDDAHDSGNLFGGMPAGWAAELATLNTADMKTRLVELHANKFGLLQNSSNELLEDTIFEGTLSAKFQAGAAWHLDRAFLGVDGSGNGAGRPLGMLNPASNALVVVAKQSWQAAGSFVFENACDMFGSMSPSSQNKAVWVFSSTLVPQLLKMQNVVKNVAQTENVGGSSSPQLIVGPDGSMSLLTRPVIISEKMSASGVQGDAAFIDFSQYVVGMRREIRLERSIHAGFATDSTWFRLTCRVDGQPLWARAQKLLNGETVSPFVTLAAR